MARGGGQPGRAVLARRWRPGANPKNLLLAVGGATAIAQTGIPGGQQTTAYLIFALISTLGVGIPVAIHFAMGARSESSSSG
jgi:hypothetical protein